MESTDKSYEEGNPQDLFDEVDDLLNNGRCLDAYNLLESRSASSTEKLGWLYRAALACYNKGCSEDVDNSRLQWLQKGQFILLPLDVDLKNFSSKSVR
ncbi:hypothetical protein DICVIV_09722 [Dictyocaulus viviparus]|uniref:Tetratricopeptide repeat protein n=1 Tax=Dictyocaulus viviparus TaxID=29172 RepID=A0A0D8XHX6_DICVI|nr:hypothetical protein DICVIV_09722 [Dictyocaulus viviparus]